MDITCRYGRYVIGSIPIRPTKLINKMAISCRYSHFSYSSKANNTSGAFYDNDKKYALWFWKGDY